MKKAILACGVLLMADAILLWRVTAGRREVASELRVSEQVLWLRGSGREDSTLSLRPQWRAVDGWLTRDKLADLGVHGARRARKPVLAVVDARAQVVDAGLDVASLRARYPDRTAFGLTPAIVSAYDSGGRMPQASISLLAQSLSVPAEYRGVFETLAPPTYPPGEPRFEVSLCFSAAGEIWICGARRLP